MDVLVLAADPAGTNVTAFDILNLFSAAASIVLAVVALALSIFFFVQSKNAADQSAKSAEEISASVSRLEKLFDSLYSDTFTMMRETVTDMRHHVWRAPPKNATTERDPAMAAELERFQSSFLEELAEISKHVGITDAKIETLQDEIQPVIRRTLTEQEEVVGANTMQRIKKQIIAVLKTGPKTAGELTTMIDAPGDLTTHALFDLRLASSVTWDGPSDSLRWQDWVLLIPD